MRRRIKEGGSRFICNKKSRINKFKTLFTWGERRSDTFVRDVKSKGNAVRIEGSEVKVATVLSPAHAVGSILRKYLLGDWSPTLHSLSTFASG